MKTNSIHFCSILILCIIFTVPVFGAMWQIGSAIRDQAGVYGTQGVPSLLNIPGARVYSAAWTHPDGDFYLFGGRNSYSVSFNDLWRYDGIGWTWVKGSDVTNQPGVYGNLGEPNSLNVPGARNRSCSWTDEGGLLWLFGGYGYDSAGSVSELNDLWVFDGSNWMWAGGSDTVDQAGVYGILGVADVSNHPGSRYGAVCWNAGNKIVYLFGGYGYDSVGNTGQLNDFWQLDTATMMWTWIGGSDTRGDDGFYGIQGVANVNNMPGCRMESCTWIDYDGKLWLFGGFGMGEGLLNDLWRYDNGIWTWMSGSNTIFEPGIYGVFRSGNTNNTPGSRMDAACWSNDAKTELYLFGGDGYGAEDITDIYLNDVWKYNVLTGEWSWIDGTCGSYESGIYGQRMEYSPEYHPGSRYGSAAFKRNGEEFPYIFGGFGLDKTCHDTNCDGNLNDLWRMEYMCSDRPLADLDGDCLVDLMDLAIFAGQWLN